MNLLLSTEQKQQQVLLNNLTSVQTDVITEIFHNLGYTIKFQADEGKLFKKHLKTIQKLSQVNKTRKVRNATIKRNVKEILKIFDIIGQDIIEAGKYFNAHMNK